MQERILIAQGGTELLRMLARHGCSTLGLRIMQPAELAQFALMRSGIAMQETLLRPDEEAALIFRFLPEIPYFANASYHDAQCLAASLRMLRAQITGEERSAIAAGLSGSPFTEKNSAIMDVFDRYTDALRQMQAADTVCVMRRAIADAAPLRTEITLADACPVTPLERALLTHLSGGTLHICPMRELLGRSAAGLSMPAVTESYGAANEAEAVLGTICAEHLPLDQCTAALTDAAVYAPLLFELCSRLHIPATFGCGLPLTLTQPAAVLRDYLFWQTAGHFGVDALTALLCGAAFDTGQFCADHGITDRKQLDAFLYAAGSMRLSSDISENRARIAAYEAAAPRSAELLEQLRAVFAGDHTGCANLIRKYAKVRKNDLGRLDAAAQHKICDTLERFAALTGQPADRLIPELLHTRICAENSREGALHITQLSGALPALRQNLFLMGMSAELFPGAPSENYLLLDDELQAFGEDAPTSVRRIAETKQMLHDLLQTAAALGIRTEISYCGYDTAELKANNASAELYTLYLAAGGTDEEAFKAAIRHTGYFTQNAGGMTEIGRAYLAGRILAAAETDAPEITQAAGTLHPLTPSRIEQYLECPKQFCYQHIMKLEFPEPDDVFCIMTPAAFGTLVHEAMECLCGSQPDADAFAAHTAEIFRAYLTERPPMNPADAEKSREELLRTAENGYLLAEGRHLTAAEQEISAEYPCGIRVYGRPDALEALPDGTFRVIDYKTGRNIRHDEENVYSCIQVMLYADMLTRAGKTVTGGEYWYLRTNTVVPCAYSPERAAIIETVLAEIAEAMRTNQYPAQASKEACRYCPYKGICEEGGAVKC